MTEYLNIVKHYANTHLGQTHYRRCGSGEPVVLLHASPMSSAFMAPMMQSIADCVDVIAPDTPGYGNSDPLAANLLEQSDGLSLYVTWLNEFLDCMGLDLITLYGSATGAQIAIEFAKAYPQRVRHLVIDNAAHFFPEEVEDVMQQYFPSLSPNADGSHLNLAWEIANSVFQWFPWYAKDDAHRIGDVEPPVEFVHATAMAYLNAGEDYAQAYRRAFYNESVDRLLPLSVPTSIVRWPGSVVRQYVDRLDEFDLPSNFTMCHVSGDAAERLAAIRQILTSSEIEHRS